MPIACVCIYTCTLARLFARNLACCSGQRLDVIEVTQNEDLQKSKLRAVLDTANRLLGVQSRWTNIKWTVEGTGSVFRFAFAAITALTRTVQLLQPAARTEARNA